MHSPRLIAAVALVNDLGRPTRLLAARRTAPAELAGLWEFPGGKVEVGEEPAEAARREAWEELGLRVRLGEQVPADADWPLAPPRTMRLWWAEADEGEPQPLQDHDELRWLTRDELDDVPWLAHDRPIVEHLRPLLHPPNGGLHGAMRSG